MAKVTGNNLTSGLRGKVGKLMVFRVIQGETYVSHAPRKPDKRKETPRQRSTRVKFKEASRWDRIVLLDPEKKKHYQQYAKAWKLPNAYTAAIKDYMSNFKTHVTRDQLKSRPEVVASYHDMEGIAINSPALPVIAKEHTTQPRQSLGTTLALASVNKYLLARSNGMRVRPDLVNRISFQPRSHGQGIYNLTPIDFGFGSPDFLRWQVSGGHLYEESFYVHSVKTVDP
jgi:hypothetical protein